MADSSSNNNITPQTLIQRIRQDREEMEVSTKGLLSQLMDEIDRFSKSVGEAEGRIDAEINAVADELDGLAAAL